MSRIFISRIFSIPLRTCHASLGNGLDSGTVVPLYATLLRFYKQFIIPVDIPLSTNYSVWPRCAVQFLTSSSKPQISFPHEGPRPCPIQCYLRARHVFLPDDIICFSGIYYRRRRTVAGAGCHGYRIQMRAV